MSEPRARKSRALQLAGAALFTTAALLTFVLISYERSIARVPEHRAALERLVRSHTGLDVRFRELGLRWGWYGPEAVMRQVELGAPGQRLPLLRAPELIVSFDLWSMLRSGDVEAGRLKLLSPDIDLASQQRLPGRAGSPTGASATRGIRTLRLDILNRWRGGRLDIEGGTLELPDLSAPLSLAIRSASLRRTGSEWSADGLFFLPESLGSAARVRLRLAGDPALPGSLGGRVRFTGQQLRFAGWQNLLRVEPALSRYMPRAGTGDLELTGDISRGQLVKAKGQVRAAGLELEALLGRQAEVLSLAYLRGQWRLERRGSAWHVQVDALELGEQPSRSASLVLDANPARVTGRLERAPLGPVVDIARWLAPHLALAGAEIEGTIRELRFDWSSERPSGRTLEAQAALEDVAVSPPSRAFTLRGLTGQVEGTETELLARGESQNGRLELAQILDHPLPVDVASELRIRQTPGGWELTASKLELRHDHTLLDVQGTLTGFLSGQVPVIAARGTLIGADVLLLEQLAGSSAARAFGAAASRLTAGRVENAELLLRGPLDERLLGSREPAGFTGSLTLRDGVLSGGDLWPDAEGLIARVEWRGASIEAQVKSGHAGPFRLDGATAEWDALGQRATHLTGRVRGKLEDAMAWLREHPALEAYVPRVEALALKGDALVDLNVHVRPQGPTHARVIAQLDQGELQPAAGLPPISALHGTLTLRDGRLRRSTLMGSWLGGPATLRLSQRSERGAALLSVQGHGWLDAGQLTFPGAPTLSADPAGELSGTSPWSGELTYLAARGAKLARWRARAESGLVGVSSALPEPLGKEAASAVPLRVEAEGSGMQATLRVALGDRLRSVLALSHEESGSTWSIERGDVRLGSQPGVLPSAAVLQVQGRVSRLELPSYLLLWQQLRRSADAPAIEAQLLANELLIAGDSYHQVRVLAGRTPDGDQLQLESSGMSGSARWPRKESQGPAQLRFTRLTVPEVSAAGAGFAVLAALGPATQVSVEDLVWAGHSLGKLSGRLTARSEGVDIDDILLAGPAQQGKGALRCRGTICRLKFSLDTGNAAATLSAFGFRPELSASQGVFAGELEWPLDPSQPPLARLIGHVHLALEDGTTLPVGSPQSAGLPQGEPGSSQADAMPFPLLLVPAFVAGMHGGSRPLSFSHLTGDFELQGGEATTTNLHFDGDAEILMQGRAGLLTRDYDQHAWILRGGERLPALVRHLGPTQGVAAMWLSLRELLAHEPQDRSRALLHLQGSWDDPIVVAETAPK